MMLSLDGLGITTPTPQALSIAQAIAYAEGYYKPGSPGTINAPGVAPVRNNNPCDLNGAGGSYPTIDAGWNACYGQVNAMLNNTSAYYSSDESISEIAATYAPAAAGNVPSNWAAIVAGQLGVSPSTPLSAVPGSPTAILAGSSAPSDGSPAQTVDNSTTGLPTSTAGVFDVSSLIPPVDGGMSDGSGVPASGFSLTDASGNLTPTAWAGLAAVGFAAVYFAMA